MRVYLDVCCLNRPLDDQSQDRIRLESQAVLLVLVHVQSGRYQLVNSDAVEQEVANIANADRREKVQELLRLATRFVPIGKREWDRAVELEALGFTPLDAMHLVCAERARADVILTTDDRLLKRANRHRSELRVRVANPAEWALEIKP